MGDIKYDAEGFIIPPDDRYSDKHKDDGWSSSDEGSRRRKKINVRINKKKRGVAVKEPPAATDPAALKVALPLSGGPAPAATRKVRGAAARKGKNSASPGSLLDFGMSGDLPSPLASSGGLPPPILTAGAAAAGDPQLSPRKPAQPKTPSGEASNDAGNLMDGLDLDFISLSPTGAASTPTATVGNDVDEKSFRVRCSLCRAHIKLELIDEHSEKCMMRSEELRKLREAEEEEARREAEEAGVEYVPKPQDDAEVFVPAKEPAKEEPPAEKTREVAEMFVEDPSAIATPIANGEGAPSADPVELQKEVKRLRKELLKAKKVIVLWEDKAEVWEAERAALLANMNEAKAKKMKKNAKNKKKGK